MKKTIVLLAIMALVYPNVNAQSDVDALRYSLANPFGTTARSLSMGGAVGALGADAGTVIVNPAGLAQFKTNHFSFTGASLNSSNTANYLGNSGVSNGFRLEANNITGVFTKRKMIKGNPTKNGWVNTNWALSWNKTADFNRTVSYSGTNSQNSMLDGVADFVQGLNASALDANQEQLDYGFYYFENMFWYGYLIDSASNGNYFGNYDNAQTQMQQFGRINSEGGMHEFSLSYAANYEHKLYVGFGLNIHRLNYKERNVFTEVDNPNSFGDWNYYDFTRNLKTTGYGTSARIGAIFSPNSNIRIGGSIQTPVVFNLNDEYQDELYVVYDDGSVEDLQTVNGNFDYSITTPTKYGLQAVYLFDKKGLITAEIEQLNYGLMNIAASNANFNDVNDKIANGYQSTTNFKLGGEYVWDEFRLRAGFARQGNPFAQGNNYDRKLLSIGVGMQERQWGFDFAIVNDVTKDVYVPYEVSGMVPHVVNSTFDRSRLVLSVTSKF